MTEQAEWNSIIVHIFEALFHIMMKTTLSHTYGVFPACTGNATGHYYLKQQQEPTNEIPYKKVRNQMAVYVLNIDSPSADVSSEKTQVVHQHGTTISPKVDLNVPRETNTIFFGIQKFFTIINASQVCAWTWA